MQSFLTAHPTLRVCGTHTTLPGHPQQRVLGVHSVGVTFGFGVYSTNRHLLSIGGSILATHDHRQGKLAFLQGMLVHNGVSEDTGALPVKNTLTLCATVTLVLLSRISAEVLCDKVP